MRRSASIGACLHEAALIHHHQHHHYHTSSLIKRRFYSNCYGNYLRCNLGASHFYAQIMRAKTKQTRKLFTLTRTPKRAFQLNPKLTAFCASILLILLGAILHLFSTHCFTITTVAAANLAPDKIGRENRIDDVALHHRHHHRQLGQRYSGGHHFDSHPIRRPTSRDRSALVHDQNHHAYQKNNHNNNNNNNRQTRHLRNIIKNHPINQHEQAHRHPFHQMQHRSNLERDSDSFTPLTKAQKRRISRDDIESSHLTGDNLIGTSSPLNYYGRHLAADSEADSYHLDDILNELDSDDFEDVDDDDDDDYDGDSDDDDGDDDDDDDGGDEDDDSAGNDDDKRNQIEPDSHKRDNSFDENRVISKQHSNLHRSNRRQNLLNDQVQRLIYPIKVDKGGDNIERRHRVRGQRQSASGPIHRLRFETSELDGHSEDSASDQPPPAPVSSLVSRHTQPSPHVPYQTPIVVSISDNSYVSASPIVTRENNLDGNTDYYSESTVRDNFTTSTTATTTSNRNLRNIYSSYSSGGGNSVDLDSPVWRKPVVAGAGHKAEVASTHFKVYKMQTPIVFSNFDRYHYNSDHQQSYQTNIAPKRDRSRQQQQQDDNNIEQLNRTTVVDQSKKSDKIRTNMIVLSPDADQDDADRNRDPDEAKESSKITGVTTMSPSWSTFMQASSSDNYLSAGDDDHDDDLNDDEDAKEIDIDNDNDDSNASPASRLAGHSADLGADIADVHRSEVTTAKYSNMIIGPDNAVPSFGRTYWRNPHVASIQMVQEDPNELNQGGINSAIIAMLFGIGATGMLIMVVGLKMRTIRERVAYKGQRRSLVSDTDFLINTIPIRSDTFHSLDRQT